MLEFEVPAGLEKRPLHERLRTYARQVDDSKPGGLRFASTLIEAADELVLHDQTYSYRPPR